MVRKILSVVIPRFPDGTPSLNQMPKHGHDVGGLTDTRWGFAPSTQQFGEQFNSGKSGMLWRLKTDTVGGNEDLSILPKYITKYIWEREA